MRRVTHSKPAPAKVGTLGIRQLAANDMMSQLSQHPMYDTKVLQGRSSATGKMHYENQLLDEDYGGLLLGDQP